MSAATARCARVRIPANRSRGRGRRVRSAADDRQQPPLRGKSGDGSCLAPRGDSLADDEGCIAAAHTHSASPRCFTTSPPCGGSGRRYSCRLTRHTATLARSATRRPRQADREVAHHATNSERRCPHPPFAAPSDTQAEREAVRSELVTRCNPPAVEQDHRSPNPSSASSTCSARSEWPLSISARPSLATTRRRWRAMSRAQIGRSTR